MPNLGVDNILEFIIKKYFLYKYVKRNINR